MALFPDHSYTLTLTAFSEIKNVNHRLKLKINWPFKGVLQQNVSLLILIFHGTYFIPLPFKK